MIIIIIIEAQITCTIPTTSCSATKYAETFSGNPRKICEEF